MTTLQLVILKKECMMRTLKIAVAQFEPKDGDKDYNLSVIEELTTRAKQRKAELIVFHEMSITAYTFFKDLSKEEVIEIAEEVPLGKSVQRLTDLARKLDIMIATGLVEKEGDNLYNTYVFVDRKGLVAKHRKLHPFISSYFSPGDHYTVFERKGWKWGILTCYDNNVIENVRATVLLGAEVILAPHVTMCTPSSMPGRGFVEDRLWQNRKQDPVPLRMEFDGPKGRDWLMHWLPARAYDNGVYYAFSNPIGYDGDQLKNGNALVLDPYGNILSEIKSFENEITTAVLTEDKLTLAGGFRYRNARRPELYKDILSQENISKTKPVWLDK